MNILVLTSVYKDVSIGERDSSTNIVNSFVFDWVNMGHNVIVIHNAHCYPRFVHAIPLFIKKRLAKRKGFFIADYDAVKEKKYLDNGAVVYRLPIKKYEPHKSPTDREIKNQVKKLITILKQEEFVPDVITGHWASPQMEIIALLKDCYNCPTAVVLHGIGYVEDASFHASRYLRKIDHLGVRSAFQARQLKELLNLNQLPFVCSSGVPDSFVDSYKLNTHKYHNIRQWRFTYVGRLVAYKRVDAIIQALANISDIDWEFNILGDGASRNELEKLCNELHCINNVHFMGRVPRDEVMKVLSETHVFIMISENEIFGLVYLEAMAASCITIASRNGGVDGIIVDGDNGFLCAEGDTEELFQIISKIQKLNSKDLIKIVRNGYYTANEYTDSKVAKKYLDFIQDKE